jgi:hypothetical protein
MLAHIWGNEGGETNPSLQTWQNGVRFAKLVTQRRSQKKSLSTQKRIKIHLSGPAYQVFKDIDQLFVGFGL